MRQPLRKFKKPTEGERARALAFFLVGACSTGLGYLAVLHLDTSAFFNGLSWSQVWIVIASGLGGLIALFLSGDRMGQSGTRGALRGAGGALWITFIGSLIGGTLALPLYGTMFGPFIVTVTLMGAPLLALLWAFNLFGVHMLLGIHQRERDSIFAPSDDFPAGSRQSLSPGLHGRMS
jgi:hypothetical protein